MKRVTLAIMTSVLFAGCPGGLRTKLVSTYSVNPPTDNGTHVLERYEESALSPGIHLDDALYLRVRSDNEHDLKYRSTPADVQYQMSMWLSASRDLVEVDTSSFALHRAGEQPVLRPRVITTDARTETQTHGREPRMVCQYWTNDSSVRELSSRVAVPVLAEPAWPPQHFGPSVLCLKLEFDTSIRSIPPQEQFQLKFNYYIAGDKKVATLYFSPLEYKVFIH